MSVKPEGIEHRPMVCGLCNGTDIQVEKDVGSDIDPSGEERQHIDRCKSCGGWRFWVDRWDFEDDPLSGSKEYWGKWLKKKEGLYDGMR